MACRPRSACRSRIPNALVIDIAGEASILMNMQEMSTAVQYRLPIKIFILNNEYMGMVRQWQELLHGGRYSESYSEALPDFVKLAEAYRGVGIRCDKPGDLDDAIKEMIDVDKPVIFDCVVDQTENCFPMIPSGKAHNEMLLGDVEQATSAKAIDETRQGAGVMSNGTPASASHYPAADRQGEDRAPHARRCWSTTSRACSRASSGCSPGAATTSTGSRCRRPSTRSISRASPS